jgi:hypothetical protein
MFLSAESELFGLLTDVGEITSLILVTAAFVLFVIMATRSRVIRSFQFQMFLFALILFISEVPRILGTLGFLDLKSIEDLGLTLHTAAMVPLSLFVAYRTYRFLKGSK